MESRGYDSLVAHAAAAFTGQSWQVVVGGRHDLKDPLADVLAPDWVPHDELFPRTDLFVTNGGYGGVLAALGHGVPLLIVPGQQDKPLVARNMRTTGVPGWFSRSAPRPSTCAPPPGDILGDRTMAARVRHIADRMAEAGGADRAAARVQALLSRP